MKCKWYPTMECGYKAVLAAICGYYREVVPVCRYHAKRARTWGFKVKAIVPLLLSSLPAFGTNWYVRDGGGDTTGDDWNTAFDTIAQAEAAVARGDTIYIADGSYTGDIVFNVASSGATYIYIKKATATDHGTETGWVSTYGDGQAACDSYWVFTTGYWHIDGGPEWPATKGIKIVGDSTSGTAGQRYGMIRFNTGDNYLGGVWLKGTYTGGGATASLALIGTGNFTVTNCWFNGSPWEDHVYCLQSGGSQTFVHCRFDHTGHPVDSVHRDLENVDSFQGTVGGFTILFRNCIVAGDYGDAFLLQNDVAMEEIRIENSVYSGVHRAVGFGSGSAGGNAPVYIINNTFNDSIDILNSVSAPGVVCSNNVYQGYQTDGGPLDPCNAASPRYCAWTASALQFVAGTGNIDDVVPNFIDDTSPDGADGVPFTSDDGFNLQSNSELIDVGIATALTTDILGRSRGATFDIGAYEYGSTPAANPGTYPRMNVGRWILEGRK